MRDEAHRFGITRHRKARGKRAVESVLERIPGVGPKRRKVLVRAFGSVERIAGASPGELAAVRGISAPAARAIHAFFHRKAEASDAEE